MASASETRRQHPGGSRRQHPARAGLVRTSRILSAVARVLLATLVALSAPSVQRRANGGRLARRRRTPRRPLAATLCTFHVAALHFLARPVVLQVRLVLLRTNGSRSASQLLPSWQRSGISLHLPARCSCNPAVRHRLWSRPRSSVSTGLRMQIAANSDRLLCEDRPTVCS